MPRQPQRSGVKTLRFVVEIKLKGHRVEFVIAERVSKTARTDKSALFVSSRGIHTQFGRHKIVIITDPRRLRGRSRPYIRALRRISEIFKSYGYIIARIVLIRQNDEERIEIGRSDIFRVETHL